MACTQNIHEIGCSCHPKKFVQLHLHTDGSLLDGVTDYKKVIKKAKEMGSPAIAITDHGNPCRTFDFYKECKKNDIKPILGLEFYITNDLTSRVPNKERSLEDRDYHQSVYIKNKEGFQNYNYLTYKSVTDGYYYKPRIDFDLLFEKKSGLMITTSCMASKMGNYIREGNHKAAEELFKRYLSEFDSDFYGEIQFNEVKGQKEINEYVIHLCNKYNVPMIIGGDVHYLDPQDNELQDAVIRSKRDESAEDWVIDARKLYYHSPEDYVQFNKDLGYGYSTEMIEKCFENSIKFSEKVNFDFETGTYHLPKINTGELSSKEYLEKATWEGLGKNIEVERKYFPNKYTNEDITKLENQVEYELSVIDKLGLNDYLLIVHDIITWEKENGYYVGPGRGSAAASCVAWGLGITGLNPLEHKLVFERFINPERKVMADIDWDSEMGARDKILEYLIGKYGRESVSNVATFSTYGPKSGLQAMSRGLRKDTGQDSILMRKITKLDGLDETEDLVSFFKGIEAKTNDADISEWIKNNQDTINFAQRLQGQITNIGTHAGGIVITPKPIYNYIPVTRAAGNIVTAYKEADGSSKDLSELGVLKLDALGLSSLNILKECVEQIKKDKGLDLGEQIYHLDLNDEKIINYFAQGYNYGVFQMERSKMFTDKMKVDSFQDIVAINAMNRPGPLEKFINKYGYWKSIDTGVIKLDAEELAEVDAERYPFPFMRKTLERTYGCLLYQEQFMQLVCDAAGFTYGESDSFRRVFGWKEDHPKYYTIKGYYERLEEGMAKMGYSKEDTDKFVKYCREFTGYSFNVAHSLCYAYVAWQTLYFKVYYPEYFFSAMINGAADLKEIQDIISDGKRDGLTFLPPSVKGSKFLTSADGDKTIRLGFGMIKGIAESAREDLDTIGSLGSLSAVLGHKFKKINKTQLQNLIDLGCFDEYGIDREMIVYLKDLYQDEKIEGWFTRKKQPLRIETFPPVLKEKFNAEECVGMAIKSRNECEDDKPWVLFIEKLVSKLKLGTLDTNMYKKDTAKKQNELMGFTLIDSGLGALESTLKMKGYAPLKEYKNADSYYYFVIEKKEVALTKTGKQYLKLTLDNGIKCKCWRMIDVEQGEIYYGKFKKDDYGFTMIDSEIYKAL